ncbi:hypothetical protein KBD61_01305 [Patescibacteria group bacterium]|nr:hypothetical protein [Patescibacteria group bacterium]
MYDKPTISDYYRKVLEDVRGKVLRESESQIIGTDSLELAQFYLQDVSLTPIEFDDERESSWDHQTYVKTIPAHERESFYQSEGDFDFACERVRVEMPIKYNKDIRTLASLTSSTFSMSYSDKDLQWSEQSISFIVETKGYGFSMDENQIASKVNEGIGKVQQAVGWKNGDITKENASLLTQTRLLIDGRKKELEQSKGKIDSLMQKINIPLKKKVPEAMQRISIDHKPIVKRIKPAPQLPEEYQLDENKVNDIVEVLDNQSKSFEKTPNAVAKLGEEDLRDLILANLNSIFEGKATGETFSNQGKTDIYLNLDKGKILVFECKIWGGKKLLLETIDQLRSYLTWRHNYGVVIFFVKLKNFTKILDGIDVSIKESSSCKGNARKINETHFTAAHSLQDEDKEVKIHYLFYNLYTE